MDDSKDGNGGEVGRGSAGNAAGGSVGKSAGLDGGGAPEPATEMAEGAGRPAARAMPEDDAGQHGAIETVVVPRVHDLGDRFEVRRALPSLQKRMVGPFVFLDQMGPHVFAAGRGLDVRPHPHIGLSTVSYLFDGEIMHRDSVGSRQAIQPGDVNWMTAGSGIVHSERTAGTQRAAGSALFGLQCWVALPRVHEEVAPSFRHIVAADLPVEQYQGVSARVIAGRFFGRRAPTPTFSDLFYVDVQMAPGTRLEVPADYAEQALYIVSGTLDLGSDGSHEAGRMLVMGAGKRLILRCGGEQPLRLMLLGGERFPEARYLSWNFVSSSAERIDKAAADWREGRFDAVPEETEFIPLPDNLGKPVHYP